VLLDAGWRSATATAWPAAQVSSSAPNPGANLLEGDVANVGGRLATRFDSLLSLDVEQRLFADLPMLAARAATEGKVEAVVESEGARFAVPVDAQLFADAAQPFYRELMRLTRNARIAGQDAALVLHRRPKRMLHRTAIEAGHRLELVEGDDHLLLAVRCQPGRTPPRASAPPHCACRWHSLSASIEYVASASTSAARALPVTHILFGGDSMRFPDVGLVIGTEEVDNAPHIALPRAAAGVSRRHCSLRREGERTVLIDHSRYGTWVNGARVRERAACARRSARRYAGRGVHAHFPRRPPCARAREKAPRLRSLHAVVPRLHRCGFGAVVCSTHRAGAEARRNPASTSSPAR
jgi:hypothetical protein